MNIAANRLQWMNENVCLQSISKSVVSWSAVLFLFCPLLVGQDGEPVQEPKSVPDSAGLEAGQTLFAAQCASCHGVHGQGAKEFPRRLEGELSVVDLTQLIQETMPEEAPGSLSDKDAQSISRFVYETFYSSIARERNRPARIELTRLTVEQYRQSAVDLMAGFVRSKEVGAERGLKGTYVGSSKLYDRKAPQKTRIDPQINFDFGTQAPIPEIEDPNVFSIRWQGSVLAPETGKYKISLHSQHAVKLWLNGPTPIIDGWVKSEANDHFTADVFLVGGRYYPIRLEFTKAKQGVKDKIKKVAPQEALVSLQWRRPQGVMGVIPTRLFSPVQVARKFVCATPFPPDDRSYGWVRGTSVSREWDRAATFAALEASAFVTEQLNQLAGTKPGAKDRADKIREFCHRFVDRAIRSPVSEADGLHQFVESQFLNAPDVETAVRRVVLLALKSPRFLYRELHAASEAYLTASRLSYGIWNSVPDERLLELAQRGQLKTAEQISGQADRMLTDERATQKLMGFLRFWLQIDTEHNLNKDTGRYPGFDEVAMADLRDSLELGLYQLVTSSGADYRSLILGDEMFFNARLARLFEMEGEFDDGFRLAKLEPQHRAGVITHPYMLAQFSYPDESSPIHRGVFIARNVLGIALRPPPEAAAPFPAELHEGLTTRERVALQTNPAVCMSCHQIINPLGFALENFDAVGRYRVDENEMAIDSKVRFDFGDIEPVSISSVDELAQYVLSSQAAQTAFCERLFQFLVGQPVLAYGPDVKENLRDFFVENEFNIRLLAREIMVVSALQSRDKDTFENDNEEGK